MEILQTRLYCIRSALANLLDWNKIPFFGSLLLETGQETFDTLGLSGSGGVSSREAELLRRDLVHCTWESANLQYDQCDKMQCSVVQA